MADASGPISANLIIQAPLQLIFGTGQSSNDVYVKEVAGGLSVSQPLILPSTGVVIPGGSPVLVQKADMLAQAANIGSTLLYAVPSNGAGMYRINAYTVLTQAATVSSTVPSATVLWTDIDVGNTTSATFTPTNAANILVSGSANAGSASVGAHIINAKASTNIQFSTTGYASSGATPMQYAIHVKLEYLGA